MLAAIHWGTIGRVVWVSIGSDAHCGGVMLAAIHWGTIGRVVWVSIVAGIAVAIVFSLVVLASARATEHRHAGRSAVAFGFGVLGTVAFAVFAAGIALGVHVMLQK